MSKKDIHNYVFHVTELDMQRRPICDFRLFGAVAVGGARVAPPGGGGGQRRGADLHLHQRHRLRVRGVSGGGDGRAVRGDRPAPAAPTPPPAHRVRTSRFGRVRSLTAACPRAGGRGALRPLLLVLSVLFLYERGSHARVKGLVLFWRAKRKKMAKLVTFAAVAP